MTYYLLKSYYCGGPECCGPGGDHTAYIRIRLDATDLEEAITEVRGSYWSSYDVGATGEQFIVDEQSEFQLSDLQNKYLEEARVKAADKQRAWQETHDRAEFERLRKKFTPEDS